MTKDTLDFTGFDGKSDDEKAEIAFVYLSLEEEEKAELSDAAAESQPEDFVAFGTYLASSPRTGSIGA